MKVAKVSGRIRYAAFLSPVTHSYRVEREELVSGAWILRPGVVWNCGSEDAANRLCDKQAALERRIRKDIEACQLTSG